MPADPGGSLSHSGPTRQPSGADAPRHARKQPNRMERFFELDKHVVEDWIGCIGNAAPCMPALIKLAFAVNIGAALVAGFAKELHGTFFFKLTHLSGMALVLYLFIMAWLGLRYGRCRTHWGSLRRFLLSELHFSCWMFQSIIPPIYWTKVYRGGNASLLSWWQDTSVHGMGLVVLATELALARRWYLTFRDTLVNIVLMLLYMFWMWISTVLFRFRNREGRLVPFWPYPIYKFDYRYAPVSYLATLAGVVVLSLAIVAVHRLKNRFAPPFGTASKQ